MGQDDINNFLRRYRNRWFSSNELVEGLKVSRLRINKCLLRMRGYDEVDEKAVKGIIQG